ncbi:hypothetical protein [Streptomyces sp. UG1]|uniref:hypothetical protein n=1 Tax=Streptomyces sp. UG1 TaxID=3417652 RepID=UPI003CF95CD9
MRPKRWMNSTGGALLLAAAGIVAAPSAQADEQAPTVSADLRGPFFAMETNDSGQQGGVVYFEPVGDEVSIYDQQSDGKYVQLDVWNATHDPNTKEYRLSTKGDDEAHADASMGQPWNMAEGHCFRFRIRLVSPNGEIVAGSADWANWRNNDDSRQECPGVG